MLQKLSERQSDPPRPAEKRDLASVRKQSFKLGEKPLGDFYTASPSSISNASAYTRLASGTLRVLKEGLVLTYWGFMVPSGFVPASC